MRVLIFCAVCVFFASVAGKPEIDAEPSILNLHHDHCRTPMTFSMEKLRCECPKPLERVGNRCVCSDCFRETVDERYNETELMELPEYINEVFQSF